MATVGITATVTHGGTPVDRCKNITYPTLALGTYDSTALDDDDYARRFEPGLIDAGTLTFEAEYTSDTYTPLVDRLLAREKVSWVVTGVEMEGDVWTCDGILTKCDVDNTTDAEVMIKCEVKLSGLPILSNTGST